MTRLIGVTGATGAVGGHVAALLARRAALQRLLVRDPARAPLLTGAEVRAVPRGYDDGDAMAAALQGLTPCSSRPPRRWPPGLTGHEPGTLAEWLRAHPDALSA